MDSRKASRAIEGLEEDLLSRSDSPMIRGKKAGESPQQPGPPPVTPGVRETGHSAYLETPSADDALAEPSASSDSYFQGAITPRQDTALVKSDDVKTPQGLLDKLSLSKTQSPRGDSRQSDPKSAHSNLNLSGGIISATFVVPFTVKSIKDSGWVILLSDFAHLELTRNRSWVHVLVHPPYSVHLSIFHHLIRNGIIRWLGGPAKLFRK